MHDNRNKEVIKRVEKGMMKANRTRNTFAIVAVALTTFMITTVFSLGINYKENMELTSVRTSGTNANVSLAMPTNAQEKEIRDLDYVKMVGTQYMIGSVAGKNEADRDLAIAMQYYDTRLKAGSPPACSPAARCWTSTAIAAATTSNGPGRPAS